MTSYISGSSGETKELGRQTAKDLESRTVLALYGELGSGKTTFVQGLAEGLGIKKRIISPTFILVREHKLKSQNSNLKTTTQNSKLFYHIDLYRIDNEHGIEGLGLGEIISNPQNIVVIEWAEKMKSMLPKERINVYFKHIDEHKRRITVRKSN